MAKLAHFNSPPVVEVVLGVQFRALPGFSTAHAGWFWKQFLDSNWVKAKDAPRLDDQLERFGTEIFVAAPPIQFRPGDTPERMQLFHADDQRMIQLQDTRFIYNWRKRQGDYPTYEGLLPEFRRCYGRFYEFVQHAGLGELSLNQWEIVYVNQIAPGELWTTPNDWPRIFPQFYVPGAGVPGQSFGTFGGEWHQVLGDNQGRLRISLKHGKTPPRGTELLILTFTARGPVTGKDPEQGFALGHDAVVNNFLSMTAESAHKAWGRSV